MIINNLNYTKSLRNFHKRQLNEVAILLYHGVTKVKSAGIENYSGKHIAESVFLDHMNFIRDNCHPISIEEYVYFCENDKNIPPKSVIISFDDGFKNNFSVAAPILDSLGIPAVFYITSGIVNTNLMFWVDIIEDCLNGTRKTKINIKLNKQFQFSLDSEDNKIKALDIIKTYCKSCDFFELKRILFDIEKETDIKARVENSVNYQKISWEELKMLDSNQLFEIGGHSLYHNILSSLSPEALEKDVRASLDLLEINLQKKIVHYSYPEGQKNHFNDRVIDCLKRNGIVCSPSAIVGLNPKNTDLFNLKRIMVGISDLPFPYYDKHL